MPEHRMTDEEVAAFLATEPPHTAKVATTRKDGRPWPTVLARRRDFGCVRGLGGQKRSDFFVGHSVLGHVWHATHMTITGISHTGLTVTDLDRSKKWYADVLGWAEVYSGEAEGDRFALGFVGPVGVALRQAARGSADTFTADRTGLDHLAFAVDSRDDLAAWEKRF